MIDFEVKRLFSMILLAAIGLVSCNDDDEPLDVTAPTIEVEEPVMGERFQAGAHAHFEATFKDDIELATYKIDIHENFDGHSHGRIASGAEDPSLIKWTYSESFIIPEGLTLYEAALEDEIEIPSNTVAGPYHFIVQAIDKAGNSTGFQDNSAIEMEVYIVNNSQPVVDITNLENDELEIEVGVLFMAEGNVTDPTTGTYAGMHALEVVLGEGTHDDHDHDHGGRIAEDDLIDQDFEENDLAQFMVDDAIILDKVFESINFTLSKDQLDDLVAEEIDHLILTIKVHDEQGNITVSNTEVHIHQD
ncbi:MAG: DUF4625 domain-containing protein [Cytophagales bacterium]|nr:DUF4625 domain-containing protein [Cytophagales bacterium]